MARIFEPMKCFFSFTPTATTQIYTLSLHDALPISSHGGPSRGAGVRDPSRHTRRGRHRSEEHTSELQSRFDLVCRLLLEKKNARHAHGGAGVGRLARLRDAHDKVIRAHDRLALKQL